MSDRTDLEIPQTMDANPPPADLQPAEGERQPTAREAIMAAAVARRQAQIEADNVQAAIYSQEATDNGMNFPVDDDEPAPAPGPAARQVDVPRPPVEAPLAGTAAPSQPVPAPHQQVRSIVVDGREMHVTDEQLVQLAQLGMVTNVALHQYQSTPAAPEPAPPPAALFDEHDLKETVRKIQYGGEDDAATALGDLITKVVGRVPVGQQIDPNAIVHQAVQVAARNQQLANDTARIRDEYPEIFADPQRTMLAKLNVDAIRDRNMRTGKSQSELDIYREAGDAVYSALGKPRPGSETVNEPAHQAATDNVVAMRPGVVERKRSAPRATQTIDMRAPSPQVARAPTGSEIVERMRQSRGQSSMR